VGLDEPLDSLVVGIRDDDLLDRSDLADRLELGVRLDTGPDGPRLKASSTARWSVATAAAAPVRFMVSVVPSMIASGNAVSGSE